MGVRLKNSSTYSPEIGGPPNLSSVYKTFQFKGAGLIFRQRFVLPKIYLDKLFIGGAGMGCWSFFSFIYLFDISTPSGTPAVKKGEFQGPNQNKAQKIGARLH